MKVNSRTIQNGIRTPLDETREKKNVSGSPAGNSRGTGTDRIELSASLNEVEKLSTIAAAMPGVSSERIEALKKQIADGDYRVSGQDVARRMLQTMGIQLSNGEEV